MSVAAGGTLEQVQEHLLKTLCSQIFDVLLRDQAMLHDIYTPQQPAGSQATDSKGMLPIALGLRVVRGRAATELTR